VVGGYTPDKVALRRAIALAVDVEREIQVVRRGQAIPAQSIVAPNVYGYDPAFKSEMGEFNRSKALALLDLAGYVDRDGDGWRDQPDGSPLTIEYSTQPDDLNRQIITQWKKNMDAIGIRIEFQVATWPENLKASGAGRLMMWTVGWNATTPDGMFSVEAVRCLGCCGLAPVAVVNGEVHGKLSTKDVENIIAKYCAEG
jgi:ABC-type transport system substrate-binding protein